LLLELKALKDAVNLRLLINVFDRQDFGLKLSVRRASLMLDPFTKLLDVEQGHAGVDHVLPRCGGFDLGYRHGDKVYFVLELGCAQRK
jgi:hypothetical protein